LTLLLSLVRLRWAIVVSLGAALVASAELLELSVRYGVAVPTLGLLGLINLWLRMNDRADRLGERALAVLAAVDMVAIAVVLAASGGAANPFSALLLVYVALAASMFAAWTTFALAALAACIFGVLFLLPGDASCHAPAGEAFSNHLYGMWIAFALVATLVAAFVTRVRAALRAREAELEGLRRKADEAAKFAAIGTLAAGAAHELGTPLGTINVLAVEAQAAPGLSEAERASLRSIVDQVERCRAVLRRMHPGAYGAAAAGAPVDLGDTVRTAVGAWQAAHPGAVVVVKQEGSCKVALVREDVEAAVNVLLDNAHHAGTQQTERGGSGGSITVRSGRGDEGAYVEVLDEGAGVAPELLARLGEPFFTTKEPGEGMGLGLYLVRTLLAQVGGRCEVERREPRGLCVRLIFGPLSDATTGSAA
jgi:two-component system sensor histidine kinase RegB